MKNKILQGDCLNVLKDIPDESIDCVITDPPYGTKTGNRDGMMIGEFRDWHMSKCEDSGFFPDRHQVWDWIESRIPALLKEAEERVKKESIYRIVDMDAVWVAKAFHDFYESYADLKGWKTQEKCRVEFDDLPEENKATMICTASAVLREMAGKLALENMGNGEFCKECKCFCGCHPCVHTKGKLQSLTEPSK